ncbi:MAG: sulfur carrier protein ThiS [Bacteroidales bacterium]|nr:sulfur carrier protein ThiS [Bacteroidales bacterium]
MTIVLNENPINVDTSISLNGLLEQNDISSRGIAVAINSMVVPRDKWSDTFFKENDQVLIIKATQGG